MTTKEYLSQILNLDKRINAKLEQITQLRSFVEKVTSPYTEKIQSSPSDTMSINISKIIDLENDINAEIDRLVDLKTRITHEIDNMPNNINSALLSSRYISGKTWREIAEELAYGERQIFRIHKNALREFRRINKTGH